MAAVLWFILAVVLIIWLAGWLLSFGGALIHILLVVALIILILNLLGVGRARV
jgi:Family of unknown function (DUF5670)